MTIGGGIGRHLGRASRKILTQAIITGGPMLQESVVLCADFDQTISARDTIALLFEAANAKIERADRRLTHERSVSNLVQQYADESSAFLASTMGASDQEFNPDREFDEARLLDFLQGFAAVDLRSTQRVVESKTLAGLERDGLANICARFDVLEGCIEVLSTASRVSVISSNWSERMIDEKLRRSGLVDVDVIANELVMDASGVTTGDIELRVQSPSDKAMHLAKRAVSSADTLVFVGDSVNDLLAMLQADIGIALAPRVDSTFVRICHHFGVNLIPILDHHTVGECKNLVRRSNGAKKRTVFTSNSWHQIRRMLR